MADQPLRVVGTGGLCSFGGSEIPDRDTWSFNGKGVVEEVKGQLYVWKKRILVGGEWSAEVSLDVATLSRDLLPTVSIGSITGMILKTYSLKTKAEIADTPAQGDKWKVKVPTGYDTTLSIESWVRPPTYGVFMAALQALIDSGGMVSVVTPFGAFSAVIDKADLAEDNKVLKESMDLPIAGAAFAPGSYFSTIWAHVYACHAALVSGDPSQVPPAGEFAIPPGSGLAYLENFDIDAPEGHVKGKLTFQGTGEWTPTS